MGNEELTITGYRFSFGGEESVLCLDYGVGCITLNMLKNFELYVVKG